ncbi:hypothetical protein [Kitasatospora kazusensis]|uniref:hypothetical protein n=1 Tax=Kitasatospora kazusensis TaxID=407974 RepID=UPI0031DA1277
MTDVLSLLVAFSVIVLIRRSRNGGGLTGLAHRARLARRRRLRFDPAAYGLPPLEQLDARRAGPPPPVYRSKEIQAIAHAAWEGDWRPAAAYVEAAGRDWDERWSRMELLQQVMEQDDSWLDAWLLVQPDSCEAATLHAQRLLHQAWAIRGSEYANKVPADRMAAFRRLVPASIDAAKQAAELGPQDPGPWVVMVTAARGAQYSHEQFRPLWEGLVARAPHHYTGHWQAMQYWCAKWFGSNRLMLEFAERTVGRAPAGSPLAGIYVHALYELVKRSGSAALPSSAAAKDLLVQAARSLDQVPEGDERLPRLRHLLAHYLNKAGRYEAALEQFRLLGPWCGAEPWTKEVDPVAAFDFARGTAATKAGTTAGR